MLDAIERGAPGDIEEAVNLAGASAPTLTRAAALLSDSDPARAHRVLEQAVALDAAPAPAQLALARSFRAKGDDAEASRWLRGAMLRARPDAALLLELATIESEYARELVDVARSLPCRDARTAEAAAAMLIAAGSRKEARIASDIAFQAGARGADFLTGYSDLLADPQMHEDPPLPNGPLGMPHWWNVATHAAQVLLARAHPPSTLAPALQAREASAAWVDRDALAPLLADRIARAEPFSWIRLGDGEARFLLHLHPALRSAIPERETEGMARQIWHVWFGQDITTIAPEELATLGQRLDQAIHSADLLGVSSVERLTNDANHYGFCASLELYLRDLLGDQPGKLVTDSCFHTMLNEREPFLSSLLSGLDFLGVISPHPELAGRLQRKLGIGAVRHYDIPGEGRLDRPQEHGNRGSHFPQTYKRIMAEIDVPRRGAVFLVAGGLLGKIYCDRVRELGGIALDIGALADAWMGYNTRGGALHTAMRWQLPA
ncbi:hypothetical protein [Sphingomonas crusticola]|uniref:GT-D fold domain-containing protein n=1 Tax=Sphingomonas crusticola TaxID=1697973 RepID=UPI0013C31F74|nr:hypothetical protein [Sphingomonas crusticola]